MKQHDQRPQSGNTTGENPKVIPVVQERLVVDKEVSETGKLHINKSVTQESATLDIPIIQEGYHIERRPGGNELYNQYPVTRYEGDTMIIPIVREVAVVEKRYEVTEELHIIKTTTEVPHQQQVTLQKETVDVQHTSVRK